MKTSKTRRTLSGVLWVALNLMPFAFLWHWYGTSWREFVQMTACSALIVATGAMFVIASQWLFRNAFEKR